MRTLLRLLLLVPVAALVLVFAFRNRQPVNLSFDLLDAEPSGGVVTVPMFVVLFATVMVGILIGGLASWRTHRRERHAARSHRAEAERLRAEAERLRIEGASAPGPLDGRRTAA